jgi:hypothetical protein
MRLIPTATAALLASGVLLMGYGAAGYVTGTPAVAKATAPVRAHVRLADRTRVKKGARAKGPVLTAINMTIITSDKADKAHPDWPRFTNAAWVAKAGETIVLTIRSYDDGPAPVPNEYARVSGTVGGVEKVDGRVVRSVPANKVAHTFTVAALGLNIPIPAAPTGGSVVVQAVIHLTKSGAFNWQCMAPCGTGASGWGGPMVTKGYMEGTIHVID